MGGQGSDNRRLCDRPGKGELMAFGCLLMQEDTVYQTQVICEDTMLCDKHGLWDQWGLGMCLDMLLNINILFDT